MNMTYRAAELLIKSPNCDFEKMGSDLSLFLMTKRINQEQYSNLCKLMDEQRQAEA